MENAELHQRFRIRLAGWQGEEQVPLDDDIRLYQRLESPFVEWRDNLVDAAARQGGNGINDEMRTWVRHFRTKGGHISRLPPDTIRFIMEHGIVVFLELLIRERVVATFGSVSALSAAPVSGAQGIKGDLLGGGGERFPNLDVADMGVPLPMKKPLMSHPKRVLYICRSSIKSVLGDGVVSGGDGEPLPEDWQNLKLTSQGFAARGKMEVYGVGAFMGNRSVLMNIGALQTAEDDMLAMDDYRTNQPSRKHNRWLENYGWRINYYDTIVPPELVIMYWQSFYGSIVEGIENAGAILLAKEWETDALVPSMEDTHAKMLADIRSGRHVPWGILQ